jgi:hypothetical protein
MLLVSLGRLQTPCGSEIFRRFGRIYRLHLQVTKVSEAKKTAEAVGKLGEIGNEDSNRI